MTNKELTDALLDACGATWDNVDYVVDRKGHDRRYSLSHDKLSTLGYVPRVRFEDGLAETVAWYRENRAWWEPLRDRAALTR
jgi:dTDP-glucose 4,6-dehydratase